MSGVELATAWIRIVPTMDGIQGAIAGQMGGAQAIAQQQGAKAGGMFSSGFGSKLGGVAIALGAAFATRAVVDWAKDSIDALKNWEVINGQTEARIASTGGAAGVTAEHVQDLASSIEALTAQQAEGIQEGANLLLTFRNIRNEAGEGNDIFDQATSSLADYAVAMKTDATSAALVLGKALNDPVAGLSALGRAGVQFTQEQKDTIASLVESGQTMEAQKIILAELQSQFGGSGAAYADTFAGKMYLLNDSVGDLGESIFSSLMPTLLSLTEVGTAAFAWVTANGETLAALGLIIGGAVLAYFALTAVMGVYTAFTAAQAAATGTLTFTQWALNAAMTANPIGLIVAAIAILIAIIVLLVMNWDEVVAFVSDLWAGFVGWLTESLNGLGSWWSDTWAGIVGFFQDALDWIVDAFLNWTLVGQLIQAITFLATNWDAIWAGIGKTFETVWLGIGSFFRGIANGILGQVEGFVNGFVDIVNGITSGINFASGLIGIPPIGRIPHVNIPKLAAGGIVMPRPGGVLSLLAERNRPEVVLPLDRLRDLVPALAGGAGRQFIYHAAPNQSFDAEQDLWTAMDRGEASGWAA